MAWLSRFSYLFSKPVSSQPECTDTTGLLCEINRCRAKFKIAPCKLDYDLGREAQAHSVYQAQTNNCTHYGLHGSNPANRVFAAGIINPRMVRENIAEGFATPRAVILAWYQSGSHRTNMLSHSCTTIGLGVEFNGVSRYWTVIFVDASIVKWWHDSTIYLSGPLYRISRKPWHHHSTLEASEI